MRIYWYWPFARQEETGIARAVLRPGDSLVVHTSDGRARPTLDLVHEPFAVVPTLPDALPHDGRSLRWVGDRVRSYATRAVRRHRLAASGFDVAHILYLNYFTDWLGLRLLRRSLAVVGTVHDLEPHERRLPTTAHRRLARAQYEQLDAIVVHHERLRSSLVEDFGVDESRIHVIPQQVPVPSRQQTDRAPSDERVVLFFGTLRADKGLPVLAEAFTSLADLQCVRLHLAGRGEASLERFVQEMAARNDRVSAEIGYASAARKAQLFGSAHVAVLPYTSFAAQSAVLHDAYSHGVPVVVTDTGVLGSTVREDGSGWVIRPGDARALADALRLALTDVAAHRRAADAAAAVAAARHPDVVGRAMRDLYDRVVSERTSATSPRSDRRLSETNHAFIPNAVASMGRMAGGPRVARRAPHAADLPESLASAGVVVPHVFEMVRPSSVVDVGCGNGAWLSVFAQLGLTDLCGIDSFDVEEALLIPRSQLHKRDITLPLDLGCRFDLVVSVEVAEHLPATAAATYVESLTKLGDLVLFSAATPGQGGPGHVNLQWPSYWAAMFGSQGYAPSDVLRLSLWDDEQVAWWYRQNILFFGTPERLAELQLAQTPARALVHPALFNRYFNRRPGGREAAKLLAQAALRRLPRPHQPRGRPKARSSTGRRELGA